METTLSNKAIEVPVGQVPAAYALLGVETGYKPLSPEALRFYLLGPRFGGKTTFISGRPRTLILDYESGAWGVPTQFQRAHRRPIQDVQTQSLILDRLKLDAKSSTRPYDHIAFDTADAWVDICAKYLATTYRTATWRGDDIRQWGVKGAGYSILTDYCWGILSALTSQGYGWTVLGHIKEKEITVNGKELTITRPVLYDMFSSILSRSADVVSTIEPVTIQVPNFKIITTGEQIEVGTIAAKRIQFNARVQETGLGCGTGKLRGVANLDMSFLLPTFKEGLLGWDTFCNVFNGATAKVSSGQFE